MVSRLSDTLLAILNDFFRAVADTGHTVCATTSPLGFTIIKVDIVERTKLYAFTTPNAIIVYSERIGLNDFLIKYWIDYAAHESVIQIISRRREF